MAFKGSVCGNTGMVRLQVGGGAEVITKVPVIVGGSIVGGKINEMTTRVCLSVDSMDPKATHQLQAVQYKYLPHLTPHSCLLLSDIKMA